MSNGYDSGMIRAFERRDAYTDALNKSLDIFVSYAERVLDDVMSNGLSPIAEVANLDRVIVFRILELEHKKAREVYRWDKKLGGTAPVDRGLETLPVTSAFEHWISLMQTDTCLSLRRSEFSKEEAAFLSPRGVMSLLVVPVFVEGEFWGVVTFHDNTVERGFDEDCTALLRSAARLCVNTIIREEKTKNVQQALEALRHREKMTDALNKVSLALLSHDKETFEDTVAAGIDLVADVLDVGRVLLYRNKMIPDGLYMSQVYRWDRDSEKTTPITRAYADIAYTQLMPNWTSHLAEGGYTNSPARLLAGIEAEILRAYEIASAAIIPMFLQNTFWGFIVFGDVHNERYFEEDAIELMRSAGLLFTNAFVRAEMENEITEKNRLLSALNQISASILKSDAGNMEHTLVEGMAILTNALNMNRVRIWENSTVDGKLYCTEVYEWSEGVKSQKGNEYTVNVSYSETIPGWEETLSQGKFVGGIVRNLSVSEQLQLSGQGIVSLLVVPVFLHDEFWGFVGFDDCCRERTFSENEMAVMRSAAELWAGVIVRSEMEREVEEAEERTRLVTEASPISYLVFDENLQVIDCNSEAMRFFACPDKQYIFDHHWGVLMPEFQPDGKNSCEKGKILSKKLIMDGEGARNVTEWLYLSMFGESLPGEISITLFIDGGKPYFIVHIYDLRNMKKMESNIRYLEREVDKIYYDALTGIYNRRFLDENLEHDIKSLSRSGAILSVLMIDVDYFKKYNDTYGHSEGDKCLKTIANIFSKMTTRTDDFVVRYGGEEFVMVLPNTDQSGAQTVAQKLLENVRNCNIPHKTSEVAKHVTISIGIATGKVEHTFHEQDFLQRADEALYESKRSGRNRYTFAEL